MPNMRLTKLPAREQAPDVRNKNFNEVSQGYDEAMAIDEAKRCLNCKHKPCVSGCPVNVRIPEFIQFVTEGKFMEAYEVIRSTNALPAVCGRVCPQETQCEEKCVRGIKGEPVGIGRLERFVADYAMSHGAEPAKPLPDNGKKIAIVGSGPAGLTCAGDLRKLGYQVTIFEALHTPGGVLVYGIPEFRLPKQLVRDEIKTLEDIGVKIETNMVVGRSITLDELLEDEGYSAVFVGSGAGLPRFQCIPGENLNGVYSANEFLTRINLMKAYNFPEVDTPVQVGKNAAVVGGGNVAMDAARSAKRLGAENVYIVYRRGEKEMPARVEEVHHAKEEGIIFKMLTNPTEILGDENGHVKAMTCVEMELGEPDASGRCRPVVKPGSEHTIDVDTVVIAIGNSPNPLIKNTTPGLDTQKWGGIIVDEATGKTSRPHVYAGGDAVTGAATVILAMGAGKTAAAAIHEELSKK
ncbi:MAG: NADPH-dependent glutamate synthase [Eubacteriales bacterium]|nr:NADPH-dependent glutamate synthase [Eubacteriales bacterium]